MRFQRGEQDGRTVRVCLRQPPEDASTSERLVILLATGLERWLAKQSVPREYVDFPEELRITTTHKDENVNEELPWR